MAPSTEPAGSSGTPRGEMDLMGHLRELRTRIIYSLLAASIGAVVAYCYAQEIFSILNDPYFKAFPHNLLIGTGPAEAFMLKLKVACIAGVILSSPFIFYQLWLFIEPGLSDGERRLSVPFVAGTSVLFLLGVSFAYFVIFPIAFEFFAEQYSSVGITPTIRATEHLELMTKALLGFGLVFETPMLAFLLGRLGIIDHHMLIASWRYAVVAIFIVAAILTPPDVMTQFLMAVPMLLLYGASIILVKYTAKPRL